MTCPDYDLCEHCEAQRIHSGHKMMRISTPESIWPGFNINSLNKMQNQGSECNKESRKLGGACRYPRGTRCPPRGFGMGGMKREGCKVLPPPFCWMTNQQSCNNSGDSANSEESSFKRCKPDQSYGARSPMTDLLNIGEIVRATEESVRTALESANLNSKDSKDSDSKEKSKDSNEQSKDSNEHSDSGNPTNDLNNVGQVIKALLSSFGVDVEVGTKTDESNKKSAQEEPMDSENSSESKNSEDKENSVDSNQTEEHQKTDSATGEDNSQTRSIPILTENHDENKSPYSALEKEVQEALEESVMPVSPKIKVALQAMENMGFNNDDGWLSDLLLKYDGDIGKVLDLINKRN